MGRNQHVVDSSEDGEQGIRRPCSRPQTIKIDSSPPGNRLRTAFELYSLNPIGKSHFLRGQIGINFLLGKNRGTGIGMRSLSVRLEVLKFPIEASKIRRRFLASREYRQRGRKQ